MGQAGRQGEDAARALQQEDSEDWETEGCDKVLGTMALTSLVLKLRACRNTFNVLMAGEAI